MADQRLIPVRDALIAGRHKVLSLDVFDTLLWRRVPEAADFFLVLAHALTAAGRLAAHISPLAFSDLRRAAERAAREKVQAVTGYREITLADIYAELPDHVFAAGFDRPARIQTELGLERDQLLLDEDVVALMKAAKSAGARVILVSDTYFSSAELLGFLAAAGFRDESLIDRVYVSCEAGKPKYRDLFDVIVKDMAVVPSSIVHIGDTLEADINPCRLRGISAALYDKWSFPPRVQTIEFPSPISGREKRAALLGAHGDFGLTGLRSRLAYRPPANMTAELKAYWSYGASVLAPVLAGFARWIVSESAERTVPGRLFGLMREGRFLKRVVEATAQQLGTSCAVEELWLSRRAVVRAGLYEDDLSLLPEAILLTPGASLDAILTGLGLSSADLNGVLPPGFALSQPNALPALSQAIAATQALKDKVVAASARLRANLLKGLAKQLDTGAAQTVTVLDLGYAATIQSVLARILAREGSPVALSGLYLALNDKAMANVRGGADLRAFLGDEGFLGTTAALLSRTPDVLEHACMCREGSLEAYDDTGAPILLPNQRDAGQLAQMEAMQDGIMAGVAAVNRLLGGLDRTPAATPTLRAQIAQIISGALLRPTPEEAAAIGGWKHEANFDLTDVRRLADLAFHPAELEYRGWPALHQLGRHQVYWPAAALTAANPFLGAGYAQGVDMAFEASHLTAGPMLGGVVICPDMGAGFDSKRQGVMPLAVNAFGRGEIEAMIKPFGPEAYWRLRFSWPDARAIVQIDAAAAAYIGEHEQRPAELRPVTWTGAFKILPGVYMIEPGKPAEAIIALNTPPAWPHALQLILRFKYLKLDPIFGAGRP